MSEAANDCVDILNEMAQIRRKLPPDIKMTAQDLTELLRVRELRRIAGALEAIRRNQLEFNLTFKESNLCLLKRNGVS